MCGIAGIHRRTDAPLPKLGRLADELMLAIENRGRHAAGYLAMMDDGGVQMQKLAIPASRFVLERKLIRGNARTILLHTRWATVGRKEDPRNAHPVAAGTIAAIHNGTIYNATALFQQYKLPRLAEVDSEIFPALINHLGWDNVEKALAKMQGGAAVALVNTEAPDEVILARLEHYPLVYAVTKHAVVWASTEKALREAWFRTYNRRLAAKVITMREGDIARVNGKVTESRLPARGRTRPLPTKPKGTGVKVTTRAGRQTVERTSQNRTSLSKGKAKKRARVKHGTPVLPEPIFAEAPRVSYGYGFPSFDPGYHDEAPLGSADEFYDAMVADGMPHALADTYAYSDEWLPGWVETAYADFLPLPS